MKQIVSNYNYSPTTNVVTLTGVNIDQDQLLLVVAPQVGRTMYNFASGVTGAVSAGANTRVTLNASTAGLTTTSPLVIFYDDHTSTQTIAGTVTANVDQGSLISGFQEYADSYTSQFPVGIDQTGFGNVPISGTVTANVMGYDPANQEYFRLPLSDGGDAVITYDQNGGLVRYSDGIGGTSTVSLGNPFPIRVQNSVTIGSLPAISGTVTARLQDASGNNLTSTSIGGVQRLNVSLASAATAGGTLPSFINIHGGTDGSVARTMLLDSSGRTVVTVSNFPATQAVSLASTTVTVSALPSGALTTRFGSVTTANTAQITSAVTNTSRKYLLAQNISAGTVTIGIGFSPTTTQGIQLTAGAGITFESSYIPTGAVYVLSSVTASNFTILEA